MPKHTFESWDISLESSQHHGLAVAQDAGSAKLHGNQSRLIGKGMGLIWDNI